jgi:hypothetical protein
MDVMRVYRSCGKEFRPSSRHLDCQVCRGKRQKKKICPKCKRNKISVYSESVCRSCRNKGNGNGNWKGGKIKHRGYMMVSVPNHPIGCRVEDLVEWAKEILSMYG